VRFLYRSRVLVSKDFASVSMALAQAPTVPRAALTGWLKKRKSEGSKSQLLSSVNKRFFTLDFDGQILYYSHSQSNKNVSMPILFRQLLAVEPLARTVREAELPTGEVPEVSEPLKQRSSKQGYSTGVLRLPFSSQALMHSIPSFSKRTKQTTEQHGFVIKLEGKSMTLLCKSKEEAEIWIDGIHVAMAMSEATEKKILENYEQKCHRLPSSYTRQPSIGELSSSSERSTMPPSSHMSPRSSGHSADGSEPATPLVAPGGTVHEFPPLAPGTPPLHAFPPLAPGSSLLEQQGPSSPSGFTGDIVRRSPSQGTLPLAPGVSLRATASESNALPFDSEWSMQCNASGAKESLSLTTNSS